MIHRVFAAVATTLLMVSSSAIAGDDPIHERHELMENTGKAAKPVGQMLKGEAPFDAARLMESLQTFEGVAAEFGGLFPAGSESGGDTKADPAIWEDREGFEAALLKWQDAVAAAIDAQPADVDAAKAAMNPVFGACKGCHDNYRIPDDD